MNIFSQSNHFQTFDCNIVGSAGFKIKSYKNIKKVSVFKFDEGIYKFYGFYNSEKEAFNLLTKKIQ